jgi:hypothetical protein
VVVEFSRSGWFRCRSIRSVTSCSVSSIDLSRESNNQSNLSTLWLALLLFVRRKNPSTLLHSRYGRNG